mgnify:CR=1 FL=1
MKLINNISKLLNKIYLKILDKNYFTLKSNEIRHYMENGGKNYSRVTPTLSVSLIIDDYFKSCLIFCKPIINGVIVNDKEEIIDITIYTNRVGILIGKGGATYDELICVEGVGDVMAKAYVEYFADSNNMEALSSLLEEIVLEKPEELAIDMDNPVASKTFVITGSVDNFSNRDELVEYIENYGGKVIKAISNKVNYLINNDLNSTSTKNTKAKELGIQIISENDLLEMTK